MLIYSHVMGDATIADGLAAMGRGLSMDFSMAGYLTVIPSLLIIARMWTSRRWVTVVWNSYFLIIGLLLAVVFTLDVELYHYWGFRLDMTPVFYFMSSPAAALASAGSWWVACLGFLVMLVIAAVIGCAFIYAGKAIKVKPSRSRGLTAVMALLTGLLFIPIRGGVTVSTMNMSRAYFSQNQRLNHAAINPAFSLLYSATHQNDFGSMYRFMESREADEALAALNTPLEGEVADSVALLTTSRPDIYIVILESFSAHLMPSLGGEPVATGLDSLAREGISFTNFYANGFRTDRGIPSILSAFPAQPSTSLMKFVDKTERLPSLPRALAGEGYEASYYYGGDANFTNMQAYLVNAGFTTIISDKDFPLRDRTGKWGAADHLVFDRALADAKSPSTSPRLTVIQTSSSHEPFDVPHRDPRFADSPEKNAFAYTDSCLFAFVDSLRCGEAWDRTLIVMVPDHQGCYPADLEEMTELHHIPLVMTGGALNAKAAVDTTPGSQIDIAATLLHAMGLSSESMPYSKDLRGAGAHYAVMVRPSMIGIVTPVDTAIVNCDADAVIVGSPPVANQARAFLQRLYDDISTL